MRHLNSKKTYLATVAVLVIILISHYLGWFKIIENTAGKILLPFFSRSHAVNIQLGEKYQFFTDRNSFIAAYQQCFAERQDQQVMSAALTVLRHENEELKKQLNFKASVTRQMVGATIVGNDLTDVEKTILLDRGSSDGIKVNQPVIVGNGILIGKIIKTEDHLSVARLLPDNRSKVIASLLNQEKSNGIIEGGYGLSLKLKFIPRNEIVNIGEQVITSGLEAGLPRGLLIGTIAAIENEAYQPFQQALITPAVDYSKLLVASIIIN